MKISEPSYRQYFSCSPSILNRRLFLDLKQLKQEMPFSSLKGFPEVVYAHLLYTSHKDPVAINEENQASHTALYFQRNISTDS